MHNDVILDYFNTETLNQCRVALITVYDCTTKDYPNKYIARLFDINKPTKFIMMSDSLEDLRSLIPEYMHRMNRRLEDDPVILEIFL
jgi:hypothetical protein